MIDHHKSQPPEREFPVQTITDAKALAAMANPFRSRILDALAVDGPSTASALAQRTGQAVGSASHHLKVLAEAGLVVEAPELARDRRERWWRLVAPSTRWSRAEFATDVGAVTAALAAESLALQRQFERAQEWDDAAFATQTWLKLSPAELRQLSEELVALTQRWRHRDIVDEEIERETVFVFARGFPAQP
jgi:DNA-binding transcriptional ArsR family regulator